MYSNGVLLSALIDSYVLVAKQDLTVSVAFTAISLFGMLRMPLNFIPVFVSRN